MFNSRSGRFNLFNRQQENQTHPDHGPSFDGNQQGFGPQQGTPHPQHGPDMAMRGFNPGFQGQRQYNYDAGHQADPRFTNRQQQNTPPQESNSRAMTGPIHTDDYDRQYHHDRIYPHLNMQGSQGFGPQQGAPHPHPSQHMGPGFPQNQGFGQPGPQDNLAYKNQQYPPQQNKEPQPTYGSRDEFPQMNSAPQRDDLRGLSFWQENEQSIAYNDDPEPLSDRPSPLKFMVAVMGLVFVSGVSWFIYRWTTEPQNTALPLITAENGPYKMRPENPGGMMIPHQDKLIYGRFAPHQHQPQAERLLPEQEDIYPPQEYFDEYGQHVQVQHAPMQQSPGGLTQEQKRYQQQLLEQQQQLVEQRRLQKERELTLQQQEQALRAREQKLAAQEFDKTIPGTAKPQKSVPLKIGKTILTSKPTPGFYIQVGSLPTSELAKKEWARIKGKFASLLETENAYIRQTDGTKKLYRILVGPFKGRNNALRKCVTIGGGSKVVQVNE